MKTEHFSAHRADKKPHVTASRFSAQQPMKHFLLALCMRSECNVGTTGERERVRERERERESKRETETEREREEGSDPRLVLKL